MEKNAKPRSAFHPKPEADEGEPWMLSYADMVTLLLAFFVVLLSMSKIDTIKVEQMNQPFVTEKRLTMSELANMAKELIKNENLQDQMDATLTSRGVEINFKDKILFDIGKAELKPESKNILSQITKLISHKEMATKIISIEGHTDSLPMKSEKYPSNWELSSARAASVVRFFIDDKMNSKRFISLGHADTLPKVSETEHTPGQSENRRVVIVITPDELQTMR